jgi:hypothetical protein
MADIVNRIPYELSNFGSQGGGSYNLANYQFDYAIDGIPFLSATRDQWPYTEGMAEIRKQQFDSFAEPGEQSLYGWWLRSQNSFTSGAGVLYQDPDPQNPNANAYDLRYADSLGVDPFTAGQLGLIRDVDLKFALSGANSRVQGFVSSTGVDSAWSVDGGNLRSYSDSNNTGIAFASTGSVLDLAGAGNRSLILMTDGVWSGVDSAAPAKMFSFTGTPTGGAIGFVKNRVAVGVDNKLYFAPINTGGTIAVDVAGNNTFSYTHTDPSWKWTSVTEGPTAVYASGSSSTQSAIFKFVIDFSQTGTELVLPIVTATLPTGEKVSTIFSYVGSFMGIATNKGFRVGDFDSNGDVAYGPLLFQPVGGCQGITGFDRFMYVGSTTAHDGTSGLFKVDLSAALQQQSTQALRYAYSRDIYSQIGTGATLSVTMLGATDRPTFALKQYGVMVTSASTLIAQGYLKTGRIRFNTEEPKLYKFVSLRTPSVLDGNVSFSILSQDGSEIPYVTYGPGMSPATGDVATPQPGGRQNWIALKFTLARGTDTTKGGILNGWQVKALPGVTRQRLISQTFLLFDEEMDKGGQRVGTDSYARDRFEDFKAVARAGDVVVFQELVENISTLVIIDDWKYTQLGPPGPSASTLGGYLTVVLRTVAEST